MSASLGFYLIDNWLSLTFESICLSVSSYLSHSWIGKRREKSIIIIALFWTKVIHVAGVKTLIWFITTIGKARPLYVHRVGPDYRSSWQVTGYLESRLHNRSTHAYC